MLHYKAPLNQTALSSETTPPQPEPEDIDPTEKLASLEARYAKLTKNIHESETQIEEQERIMKNREREHTQHKHPLRTRLRRLEKIEEEKSEMRKEARKICQDLEKQVQDQETKLKKDRKLALKHDEEKYSARLREMKENYNAQKKKLT